MIESARALSARYNGSLSGLHAHILDLLRRFSNKALADTCARVGADTARKLGNGDRLVGALRCCAEEGVNPVFISVGTAAALYCHLKEHSGSQSRDSARSVLREVSGLAEDSPETERVLSFHAILASSGPGAGFDETAGRIIKTALSV
jgi:mannitol-1-phosphate/altronate dehydrogenase